MRKKRGRKPLLIKPIKQGNDEVVFDYKDPEQLRKFLTEQGRIVNRARSGLTAMEQRSLAREVKRARMLALLPFAN